MLTHDELSRLSRDLREQKVLSVYVDTDQHDPAERRIWRTRLDNALTELAQALGEEEDEAQALAQASRKLAGLLPAESGFLTGTGWVAFVGPDAVHHSGPVPFRVPNLVRWTDGPLIAPYFRGLRHHRPVTVVVADRRRARVLRHQEGTLVELDGLMAFSDVGDVSESSSSKRAATSSGVRGATGKDLANRYLQVEAERLHQEVVKRIEDEAGRDGLVVLGGPSETASRIHALLDPRLQTRAVVATSLAMDDPPSELRSGVTQAVRTLAQDRQQAVLKQVLEGAHQGGKARLGAHESRKAIRESRADTLLISEGILESDADRVDELVEGALAQGASVDVLVGAAASTLEAEGEGVAVRLRY